MLIAQLTDLHIKKEGKLAYKRVDTLQCFKKAVSHINQLNPKPDCVVLTGDLGDFGLKEEYELIASVLDELDVPLHIIPGNHDNRAVLRDSLQKYSRFDHDVYCHFAHEYKDQYLIGLDTLVEGKPHGELTKESLHWLASELRENQDKCITIFMHHPPLTVGLRHMDVQNLINADELYEVIKPYSNINGFVTGHLHRPIMALWNKLPVWIAPSHSHAVTLDLLPSAPSSFSLEPAAIQLFMLEQSKVVSHLSYIDASDGPYPFFNTTGQLID